MAGAQAKNISTDWQGEYTKLLAEDIKDVKADIRDIKTEVSAVKMEINSLRKEISDNQEKTESRIQSLFITMIVGVLALAVNVVVISLK